MKIRQTIVASAIVLATAGVSAANASITFTDGNFAEANTNPFVEIGYGTLNGLSFGPWTVTSGNVDLVYPGAFWPQVPDSVGSVDLDGITPGAFQQTFYASAGNYTLSFYLGANNYGAPTVKTLDVSVGGASAIDTYDTTGLSAGDITYDLEKLNFTSDGVSPITLSFASGDVPSSYGAVVGGVSIAAVPEPATWAIMLLGVVGVGFTVRRARRKDAAAVV